MSEISKESIIKILMERDEISYEEAEDIVAETQYAINDVLAGGGDYDTVEDVLIDYLGLEMDYVFPFLFD